MTFLILLLSFLFSPGVWASQDTFVLSFEKINTVKQGSEYLIEVSGTASPELDLYLTAMRVRGLTELNTSLGLISPGNELLIPKDGNGKFKFSATVPKVLVRFEFDGRFQNKKLGKTALNFKVEDVEKTIHFVQKKYFTSNPEAEIIAKSEPEPKPEKEKIAQKKKFKPNGAWIWGGLGYNYTIYKQKISTVGAFEDQNFSGPGLYFEGGYLHSNGWGVLGSYKSTPGQVRLENTNIQGVKYDWTTISLEGMYERKAGFQLFGSEIRYGVLFGVQDHAFPYFHQDDVALFSLQEIKMQTASIGFRIRLRKDAWEFLWSNRYQYPIAIKSGVSNLEITTRMAFDGSVGASYYFTDQLKLGWFWYGQSHEYDLTYSTNGVPFTGSQSLFYSNMDLRVGYDF